MIWILVFIILIVYLFDFTKLRQQNNKIIEQNDEMIRLLDEIKNQK
ncbi:hypothetical protein [Salinibacillus xinjiangensis]|nr:hypothetical protein [Salinibacillus xinjiangensis]